MMTLHTSAKHYLATFLVFVSRFANLPANFSPVGSFGFFSNNPILFAATIVLYDYLQGSFYKGFIFTYLGFAVYYLLGRVASASTKRQVVLLPLASFLFFLLSNLGVWWFWFPQTLEGLIACFVAALPFYQNTFLSDLFFGYSYLLVKYLKQTFVIETAKNQVTPSL